MINSIKLYLRRWFWTSTFTLLRFKQGIIAQSPYIVPINLHIRPGWELIFQDNFSKHLDGAQWWIQTSERPNENAMYKQENVFVKDSLLHIVVRKESYLNYSYTSGMVWTAQQVSPNSYIEIKCKVPKGTGYWPAFWFWRGVAETYQEIDVAEFTGQRPFQFQANNYYWDKRRKKVRCDHRRIYPHYVDGTPLDITENFHVYALEWTDKALKFYFDNILVREIRKNIPTQPMHLILNMTLYPNEHPHAETLPAAFLLEYVRIFKKI